MILFTAFQATGLVEQSVLEGVKNETTNGNDFQGSGYISLAIVYVCATIANVLAPAFVFIFGAPVSMFIGATTYFFYVFSFLLPMTWSFYLTSILLGFGAAILWTAEGAYLAANSDEHTTSRNTGIFWALFQSSLLGGNLYVYLSLKADVITRSTRYPLFTVFSVVCAIALAIYAYIIWRWLIERRQQQLQLEPVKRKTALSDVVDTLNIAVRLLRTRNMLLLLIPFAYTGFSQTFFQTVYATCIGHSIKYGNTRKRLIGLHGVLLGIGEIVGGGLFGFVTKPKTSSQCALVILIGFFLQIVFYYSAWINFPADAPARETNTESYFQFSPSSSQIIAFVGSFVVGLGDSALNTQLFSVLASRFKSTSASAFALFQLVQERIPTVFILQNHELFQQKIIILSQEVPAAATD
ncbi:unnamed protein product [Rotaria sordida]|uniref:UNC93-like protein MFSD11 n=1 Tax=Rotaria sordida TaxID=392033 RepID=A0A815HBN8_9BILA|nr:unnamed protein product [Rotaria sordida]